MVSAIHWHESAIGVHVSLILNRSLASLPIPSLRVSQCTGFECPVSCIKLGLVIYFTYGNIHVSILFSQITPPLPSPTESKSLFFTALSLLLPCITIFLNSTHMHKKIIIMVDGRSSNNGDRKTWRNEVCTLGSLKDETGDQTQHPGLPDWKQPRKQCFHLLKWGKRTRGLFIFFCHSCFCCCLGGRGKYGLDRLWLY